MSCRGRRKAAFFKIFYPKERVMEAVPEPPETRYAEIVREAVGVLKIEADGILRLAERIDDSFARMVDLILTSKGRLIIGGIGKSGIVGRKIVATLNSTGTRSLFLHPVEAMHGDLGMVCPDDIFPGPVQ